MFQTYHVAAWSSTRLGVSDVPRGRLVKYPLLLKSVLKYTPDGHSDVVKLEESIEVIDDVIKLVDDQTGLSKCQFIKTKFEYLTEDQVRTVLCVYTASHA